jgi:hypothetical protein
LCSVKSELIELLHCIGAYFLAHLKSEKKESCTLCIMWSLQ